MTMRRRFISSMQIFHCCPAQSSAATACIARKSLRICERCRLVPCPRNSSILLRSKWAVGKAVRAGLAVEGAYLNRYVTDEQRSRRPIFIETLRAGASWLFFRVARSTRMTQIWGLPPVRLGPP